MKHTANLALNLPEQIDQFNVDHSNQNFTKIDTTITANKTEILTTLTSQTTRLQAQIDRLRYNEYVQFVKEHYSNTPYRALGYFCDIFTSYIHADTGIFPKDHGILVENATLKMNKSYTEHWLGSTYHILAPMNSNYNSIDFGVTSPLAGAYPTIIRLQMLASSRPGSSSHILARARTQGGGTNDVGIIYLNENEINVPTFHTLSGNLLYEGSGNTCFVYCTLVNVPNPSWYNVRIDTSASGSYAQGGSTFPGQPICQYFVQHVNSLATTYTTFEQSANTNFNQVTLYMRCKLGSGASVTPAISVNNGGVWRNMTLSSTSDTTNNVGLPCVERKYTLSGLPNSDKFRVGLNLAKSSNGVSPEIYDYCVVYGMDTD